MASALEKIQAYKQKQKTNFSNTSGLTALERIQRYRQQNPYDPNKDKEYLLSQRKKLQTQLNNYERQEKIAWWDEDKNVFENIGNVLYKTFAEKQTDKYKDDEEYKKLQKEYQRINQAIEDYTVENKQYSEDILGGFEKVGDTIAGNAMSSIKGIESTINKLTGQPTNANKITYEERLAQKAREETSGLGRVGLDLVGSFTRMIPQMVAPNPATATAVGFANYGGSAYNDAKREGYSEEQATIYGLTVGGLEMAMSKILGGFENVYGKSTLGKLTNKIMKNVVKNEVMRKTLSGAIGEFSEEYLQQFLEPIVRNTILGEENGADFWNTMKDDIGAGLKQLSSQFFNLENLYAGGLGALSSAGLQLPMNISQNRINTQNKGNTATVEEIVDNVPQQQEISVEQAVEQENKVNKLETPQLQDILPTIDNNIQENNTNLNTFINDNEIQQIQLNNKEFQELKKLNDDFFDLDENQTKRYNYLINKNEGKIKYPELKSKIEFNDIKQKYNQYKNLDNFDTSLLNKAKEIVPGYKNTNKRTKEQWLEVANIIGSNFEGDSTQLEKYAIQSWHNETPNQKGVLNRQGKSYVKFSIDEWVNAVYEGAGVGNIIENTTNNANIPIVENNIPIESQQNILPAQETPQNNVNLPTQQETKQQKVLNPNEIAQLTKEDANTTSILPTRKMEKGDKVSRFTKNIKKSNILSEQTKQTLLSDEDVTYYKSVTNQESLEKAFEKLNKGGKSETLRWFQKEDTNSDSVDIAEGFILLNQYQKQIEQTTDLAKKDELNRTMVEIARKIRNMGTKSAQTVQAMSILSRLTPEGMVYYAQSELDEAFNEMIKNKSKEWIDKYKDDFTLTPEETQFIMDTMKEVSTMEDGYDKKVKLAEIQKLMTDKLPPERGAGIKSWMRISMLFNPKTQVRNVAGNAIVAPVNWFGDLVGSAIDSQIAKKTGVRTKGGSLKGYGKGFKQGLFQSYNDFKKGINTRNIEGNRFEISQGKSFNNKTLIGKTLNKVDSLLSFMLDAGDRAFYEAEFTRSINNQLVLNNTTQVTKDIVDIATNEALQRTWQDNNNYTKFVLNIRKGLNAINVKGYGLGDVLIPFAKTPANLTKALVDYSPAGLIPAINKGIKLKRSLTNGQYTPQIQSDFVNQLGKATAGTMLYVLGMALAKAGVTSGESDDDKDVANFLKNTLGVNSYSIKIGDTSFTYDWAQPLATPFAVTSNFVQKQEENKSLLENITNVLDTGLNVIFEQSFLSSINDVLSEPGQIGTKIVEQLMDLPARAIPTLSSQIANMLDSTSRTSFEYNKPLESMLNSIKYKIPFLTESLAPNVNTLGEEIERYGGANNLFNVFLNPANVNVENINESASEIYRLYQATGDKTIMPRVAPYYINQNGEKITLSSKEKAEYQTISGNIISESVEDLLDNQVYNSMSDTDKATIINKIVNYAYNKARQEVLGIPMANEYKKINMYVADGGNASEYYTNKEEIDYSYENPTKYSTIRQITTYQKYNSYKNEIDTIKDKYDNTNERKYAVISYVNNLNLSISQKAMLIKMNYSSFRDYDNQIIEYINSQDLTIQEKTDILTELGFTVRDGRVY